MPLHPKIGDKRLAVCRRATRRRACVALGSLGRRLLRPVEEQVVLIVLHRLLALLASLGPRFSGALLAIRQALVDERVEVLNFVREGSQPLLILVYLRLLPRAETRRLFGLDALHLALQVGRLELLGAHLFHQPLLPLVERAPMAAPVHHTILLIRLRLQRLVFAATPDGAAHLLRSSFSLLQLRRRHLGRPGSRRRRSCLGGCTPWGASHRVAEPVGRANLAVGVGARQNIQPARGA
mmetsp:Transcript_12169/g.37540  ORF Transcript_12169/g.37540 Transcript_12169/m.37540 type:complete len:238 (-) Transcript_12169:104-817(-)